jgi:hypothetical protein
VKSSHASHVQLESEGSGAPLVDALLPGDTLGQVTILNGESEFAKDHLSAATVILSRVFLSSETKTTTVKIANAYALAAVRLDPDLIQPIALVIGETPQTNEPVWYLAYWTSDDTATIQFDLLPCLSRSYEQVNTVDSPLKLMGFCDNRAFVDEVREIPKNDRGAYPGREERIAVGRWGRAD